MANSRRWIHALLLACALAAHHPLEAKEKRPAMPNGTWIIEATPPANAVALCPEFLPSGTRLRLRAEGPTRLAIEEERRDELGGTLTLLPPFATALCQTGIGSDTAFGTNLCRDGTVPVSSQAPVTFDDAVFVFSRLDVRGVADPDNRFFVDRGAKEGARFAFVFLKYKAVQWDLWLKSANEMVSRCLADLPGKDNFESFPMIWRRQREN